MIAIIVIIKLIINRKITTIMKDGYVQKPATSPQIMKIHIIEIIKNKFQLNNNDCLVDFFLWNVLKRLITKIKKNNPNPKTDNII